jgi:hypothetical protein
MGTNQEYQREYSKKHSEKKSRRAKEWYLANRERALESQRLYKEKNREHVLAVKRAFYARQRSEMIVRLGGKCACCGITEQRFLSVDHINGDGNSDRKMFGRQARQAVKASGFDRAKYQVLCHNCNLAKGFYGQCPHKEMSVVCG